VNSVAVIDSGVHAAHPHVNGVAGGIAILPDGAESGDYLDRLGHGTAVVAAIKDLAPDVEIYVVKVFDRQLATSVESLVRAIRWAVCANVQLVNLSLGTARAEHEAVLAAAVDEALSRGVQIVAAAEDGETRWLPGSLAGVIGVEVDWSCRRDQIVRVDRADDRIVYRASGYPRPIPGVPPERNLKGLSFAVANTTGVLARGLASNGRLSTPSVQSGA
jgi:subtilisin family serine protease